MSRISLVEAYDNRDVIGQLVRLREDVNELQNILKDIDPDGDLTNVVTKTGDQVIDGIKTFVGKIVADCDIIQNGAAYETHAEQVYSRNDYIVVRDEAIAGLAPGTYAGLHVKKYNGVDDARLVVDNEGMARVGDVNDEQPLLTRDEVADMTSGNILSWDGVNKKAITSGKSVSDITGDITTLSGDVATLDTVKAAKSDIFFKAGDTLTNNGSQVVSGFITNSRDSAFLELPLPKQIPTGVTPTISISSLAIRGTTTAEGPTVSTASITQNTPSLLRISCSFSAAVANPANSPFVGFLDYTITFS